MYTVGRHLRLNGLALPNPPWLNMTSLLAAAGLAISYWHIYFSRVGLRAILLAPLLLGIVFCFWQGWNSRAGSAGSHRGWLIAAGLILGLSFYVYLAARLLPLLFVVYVAVDLVIDTSDLKRKIVDFLLFGLASIVAVIPLAYYFYQNPQALSGRTQALSIFTGDAPLHTLVGNLIALLRVYFLGGTWLGQWPALNLLLAVGFLAGLLVCLCQAKKDTSRFLMIWWAIGIAPMVVSHQDWGATTTILRSIIAWPALFFISAIGLTTLVNYACVWMANLKSKTPEAQKVAMPPKWSIAFLLFVLIAGGLTNAYKYFAVWATTYNRRLDDSAVHLARYLNSQSNRATLIPFNLFTDSVTNFLLQANYPNLGNIDTGSLHTLLEPDETARSGDMPAIYVLPEMQAVDTTFVLLVPSADGPGVAYLLPPLTDPGIEALLAHTKALMPFETITNGKQEQVARAYPLPADASFLPDTPLPLQSIRANFDDQVWLTGYHVEPAIAKPGERVTLYLNWEMRGPVDGDYYLFLHLFDVLQAQRRDQSNLPLNNIIHRWSAPLTFVEPYQFWLPPDSPEGVYRFEMGLYHNFSLERLPAIIGEANQASDNKVILGKLRIGSLPPAPPQHPIHAQFGESLALIGGDFLETALQPGQTLAYTLHWQVIDSIARDYTVFNHLLDAEGHMIAQHDSMPQVNQYPTSLWDPGEIVVDPHVISLPKELEPGVYTLRVGLYEPGTGQRLNVDDGTHDYVDLPGFFTVEVESD
jgi:hypothetical protein